MWWKTNAISKVKSDQFTFLLYLLPAKSSQAQKNVQLSLLQMRKATHKYMQKGPW